MIRTKLAKKVLTKKEQRHLTESGITSMKTMQVQIDFQKEKNPEHPGMICWECWFIAQKLGIDVKGKTE